MAGFPIRKSPDHSLFIDSPRHIADYNVLHRFLVPRHPPCALKNLKITDTRCSRPLCNSQTTRHTPTNPPQPHPQQPILVPTDPIVRGQGCQCQPNPRTRMMHVLRTQQRANHTHHPTSASPFPTLTAITPAKESSLHVSYLSLLERAVRAP